MIDVSGFQSKGKQENEVTIPLAVFVYAASL
jgi:hypothetical protein